MLSYIKSEFYRLVHNKWTYLFIAICSVLLVSSNIVLAAVKISDAKFPYATTKFALSMFYSSLVVVFFLCIAVSSMIFGNEHSNHTMKNSISYGISRECIYFGKLIIEIIYALVAFVIITGCDIASAYILLENSGPENLEMLLRTCLIALPLLLFALAATNCFIFIFESTGAGIGAIVGLLLALPQISNLLGMKFSIFKKLAEILPMNMINNIGFDFEKNQLLLPWKGATGYYNFWISGIVQLILITAIGFMIFRKKEIK